MASAYTRKSIELHTVDGTSCFNPSLATAMQHSDPLVNVLTPALIVDQTRLTRNLANMQGKADRHGVGLRPHVKTHKSVAIARMQLEHGAVGITASKPSEALCFAIAGIESITLAYPIVDPGRLHGLLETARHHDIRVITDSPESALALARAAKAHNRVLPTYIKVDVGLGRIGIRPDSARAVDLLRQVMSLERLELRGLLSHAGHAYGADGIDAIKAVARDERSKLLSLADRLTRAMGVRVAELSVGCTPTALACEEELEGLTEIRPGNYVFLDRMAVNQGVAGWDDIALSVLVTVVSINESHAIVDAGSKVLSSDSGPHGSRAMTGFGAAFPLHAEATAAMIVDRLSEEHGFVRLPDVKDTLAHSGPVLRVGDRLRIYPNHACPVINLADHFHLLDPHGTSLQRFVVDARGMVH